MQMNPAIWRIASSSRTKLELKYTPAVPPGTVGAGPQRSQSSLRGKRQESSANSKDSEAFGRGSRPSSGRVLFDPPFQLYTCVAPDWGTSPGIRVSAHQAHGQESIVVLDHKRLGSDHCQGEEINFQAGRADYQGGLGRGYPLRAPPWLGFCGIDRDRFPHGGGRA